MKEALNLSDLHLAGEKLSYTGDRLRSLEQATAASLRTLDVVSATQNAAEAERLADQLEHAYVSALGVALALQDVLNLVQVERSDGNTNCDLLERAGGIKTAVSFENSHSVFCRIMAPPLLKKQRNLRPLFSLVYLDLEREIVSKMPQNFCRFDKAYIIYINYFHPTSQGKQPYFDNDNIAIKGLLDAIVPHFCYDDATQWCDNIYLSQPSDTNYVEIHVVKKGHLQAWLAQHEHLNFALEIEGK